MKLYLDLDGVFADFEAFVKKEFGKRPDDVPELWPRLSEIPELYRKLPLMPHAKELWEYLSPFKPTFLSGIPWERGYFVTAADDKRWWVNHHFGPVPLITCRSKDKASYAKSGDVLLDDMDKYANKWKRAGGIFVLFQRGKIEHTVNQIHDAME